MGWIPRCQSAPAMRRPSFLAILWSSVACSALSLPGMQSSEGAGGTSGSLNSRARGAHYDRFSCVIRQEAQRGSSPELMEPVRLTTRRIRRDGPVYRIDEYHAGSTAKLPFRTLYRFRGGDAVEWQYLPVKKTLSPSYDTLAHYLWKTNREKARRMFGSAPGPPVNPPSLQTASTASFTDRSLNPSVRILGKPKPVRIAGKECQQYHMKYHPLLAHPRAGGPPGGSVRVDTSRPSEAWTALFKGIVMREVIRVHWSAAPAREMKWQETKKEVISLDLAPNFAPSTFSPPRGATFILLEKTPVKAPPGVKVIQKPGDGFIEDASTGVIGGR